MREEVNSKQEEIIFKLSADPIWFDGGIFGFSVGTQARYWLEKST